MGIPAYHQLAHSVDAIMCCHLKAWAYTMSIDGTSVMVHHRGNVGFVRQLLTNAGLIDQVRVSFY
jgi:hypothetical protein